MTFARAAAAVLLTLTSGAVTACSGATEAEEPSGGSKYEQTWERPYERTTCGQWLNRMSRHENFVLAADVLVSRWEDEGDLEQMPDDELVEAFADEITALCETGVLASPLEAAAVAYDDNRVRFKQ